MAGDNTSVGKIFLEIDLTQDLENEIGNAANKIARGLQDKLSKTKIKVGDIDFSNITKAAEKIPNNMNSAMNKTKTIFENATQSIKKSIEDNITRTLQNSTSQMGKLPSNSISKPVSSPTQSVLSTKMPEVYTPKINTDFIEAEFSEISEKASNIIKRIQGNIETTAKNTTSSFTGTTDQIKSNVEAAIDTTETKANGAIASIIARLKNIQMPKFDFSKFKINGNSVNSGGTDTQKMQLDLLTRQMDAFSAKADEARAHIRELQAQIAELSKPTGNTASDFINTAEIEKLQEELRKAEDEEVKFGDKSDAINIKIATLTDKMEQAANATNNNTKAVRGKGDSLDSTGQRNYIWWHI